MPAKAILRRTETREAGITPVERASLKKFSFSLVLLQFFPAFLFAVFVLIAGVKLGYFSLQKGLIGLLAFLIAFYFLMPRIAKRVFDGIIALRNTKLALKNRARGV